MSKSMLLAAASAALFGASSAQAITITVTPTLAPNGFGSPSYAGWVSNAVQAMYHGYTSFGDPNAPTYFHAQSVVGASQGIVTGFPSWKGYADPGTKFGAAFANELGNRMHFSLRITGDDQQISISQLMLTMASSDPDNALGFSYAAGAYNYSNDYQGVLKGGDGMLGTGDDVFITSGPNTQLVDAIVGRGSGNSLEPDCDVPTYHCPTDAAGRQKAINDAAAYWSPNGGTFTGTYTLGAATGSGTFTITAVPEPATWALMIGGFGLIGAAARRRRTAVLA